MQVETKDVHALARKHWHLVALLIIFLLAFSVRLTTADMKYIQAFDPFFHYRYTSYIADQGVLPDWDELSYYPPGRPMTAAPLMYYVTAYLFLLYRALSPETTLFVFAKYITAAYAALAVIPAYLLGRELSNKNAGLLGALFIGMSPSILSRTMAGFYDTDTIVVFFSVLTMYLFVRLIKRVTLADLLAKRIPAWREVVMATLGIVLFQLAWLPGIYIPVIAIGSVFFSGFIRLVETRFGEFQKIVRQEIVERAAPPAIAFFAGMAIVQALGYDAFYQLVFLSTFSQDPARILIVNISVAELQHTSIFAGQMRELFARISMPVIFALAGAALAFKRSRLLGSLLLVWTAMSLFTVTQGVRFLLVFAPAAAVAGGVALAEIYRDVGRLGKHALPASLLFVVSALASLYNPLLALLIATNTAVVISVRNRYVAGTITFIIALLAIAFSGYILILNLLLAIGLGSVMILFLLSLKEEDVTDKLPSAVLLGTMLIAVFVALSHGSQLAYATSDGSLDANWEEALTWLRDNTAKDAVVGTWWDPGHQLTGFAGKRVIADGAHCPDTACSPGLNTRIADLGFIFSTTDENKAVETFLKYRGDASEMYWIVSDDLIGKYQWLQFFGTGCDGSGNINPQDAGKCPLYSQAFAQRISYDQETLEPRTYFYEGGLRVLLDQGNIPIAVLDRDGSAETFEKQVIHVGNNPTVVSLRSSSNATRVLPGTIWIHPAYAYVVHIPPTLEQSMFTRMFLYEDEFEHFEMVFKNDAIRIYKLKTLD